jgi:hypothetical protein
MLVTTPYGNLVIHADVPANVTELPASGVFKEVDVINWHPIDRATSRVIDDASIPSMITLTMADGSRMAIWPDGTVVRYPVPGDTRNLTHEYSFVTSPEGISDNPYRST